MRPSSRLFLSFAALACLAGWPGVARAEPRGRAPRGDAPCTDGRHGSGSIDVTVQVKPTAVVDVHQFGGSLHVSTWGQSAVHVKGEFNSDCHVDMSPSGDRQELRLECAHGPGVGDLEIQIPQAASLDVRAMNADISVHDVGGAIHLQTVSGDIEVKGGAPTEVEVRSTSGSVSISAASPSTRAHSISGDVAVSGARGRATIRTVSGECSLGGGEFSAVEIETVSGDVAFKGALGGQGTFEMNSHSGDITLHLPRTTGADVEMRSTSGDLVIDMGSGRKTADRELDARIGPGGAKVRLRSYSGDVRVLE